MQRGRKIYQGNWLMCLWKPANQYRDFPASSWRTKKASFVIYSESEASELRASDISPNPKAHVPGALKSRGRRRWMMLQLRQGESECSFLYHLFHSDTQQIDSCPFTLGTDLLRSPNQMPVSSRSTLTDTPQNVSPHIWSSLDPVKGTQHQPSCLYFKSLLTQITPLLGGSSLLSVRNSNPPCLPFAAVHISYLCSFFLAPNIHTRQNHSNTVSVSHSVMLDSL